MSKQVDERVVSMQFDNRHFEQNVSTTMSTLDKLKQKLQFKDSTKGLENVGNAAKKVDMSGLGNAVDTVRAKFSAMDVIGVTALANITNQAVNAGKRIVSALTIDPVKTGFQEYETQINAVQTILANTQSKGTTLDDVNKALDTLNEYADKTIYNFTEMTRNIGTFTAAGVDLDTSVNAIQGIANLAAVSGSTSQQASTAMYQLSQALASGTVKLMDWNSVVNAGMGGQVFQDALKETARIHGVAIDSMIEEQGSFRETLSEGWLTSEILTETLSKFTMATEDATEAEIEANREKLKGLGYTEQQIEEIFKLGNTATNAATKVKTFTQLWDVLKEAAQSGWSRTWRLIVGDFEDAKALFTPLSDFLTGVINGMSEARNALLESALGRGFADLSEKLKTLLTPASKVIDVVKETVNAVSDLGEIVDDVIFGKFGNGVDRFNALTEAGINYYEVQNKVNEKLGDSFRHSQDVIDAQYELLGTQVKSNEAMSDAVDVQKELTESDIKRIAAFARLSEKAELTMRVLGYSEEQIAAFKELNATADKLGLSVEDLVTNIDDINGRWLLINSLKNAGQGLVTIFTAIGEAWRDAFPPMQADTLFNLIAGLHKFSTNLIVSEETADKLTRTFKGLFAIVDILATFTGGTLKIAFKAVNAVLGMFDLHILDVTALIGDFLVGVRDSIDTVLDFGKVFEFILPYLKKAAIAVKNFFVGLTDGRSISSDLISGLVNGLKDGVSKAVSAIIDLGTRIIEAIKGVLGIHSPSTVFFAIGGFIIAGLVAGILGNIPAVKDVMGGLGETISNLIGSIDFGAIFAVGISGGMVYVLKTLSDAFSAIASPFEGLGDIMSGTGEVLEKSARPIAKVIKNVGKVVKSFSKLISATAFNIRAEGMKKMATALLILVGAVAAIALLIKYVGAGEVAGAAGIIVVLAGVMAGLAWAMDKMSSSAISLDKNGLKINDANRAILKIAEAMLLLAISLKLVGSMKPEEFEQGILGIGLMVVALGGLLAIYGGVVKGKAAQNIDKAGKTIRKIGTTMLLLALVAKIISMMSWGDMGKAAVGLLGLTGIIALLSLITKLAGKNADKVGPTLIKIAGAMLIMVVVAKLINTMSWGDMNKAATGMLGMTGIIALLVLITKMAGKDIGKIGSTIVGIAGAMLALTVVAKILATMSWGDMAKAAAGLLGLVGVIALLVLIVKMVGNDAPKIAGTLLAMSVSLGILAAIAIVLGMINLGHLAKGVIAVGILAGMMSLMILASRGAGDIKGTFMGMAIAIGVMAVAVAALSFIDPAKLATATGAMMALIGMLTLLTSVAGKATGSIGSLIVMTVAIGLISGVLIALAHMPINATLGAAGALSAVLLAISGALFIMSKASTNVMGMAVGVASLIVVMYSLQILVDVLASMDSLTNATDNAIALSILVGALGLCVAAVGLVGNLWIGMVVGLVALIAAMASLHILVGVLASMESLSNAKTNAELLTNLLDTMTKTLVVLAIVGPLAIIGVGAMTALTLLMGAIGVMAVAIGALMDKFPKLEEFLDSGLPILERLAGSIGTMIGNFVAGFSTAVAESLPYLANQLSTFMINLLPFISIAKLIDESVLTGVGVIAAAIIALTVAELINGAASFISGGTSFADLGKQLTLFMRNARGFFEGAANIKPEVMGGVKSLAEAILILTATDILDSLTSWLTGGSSLSDFGEELASFGPHIAAFAESVKDIDPETVTAAANAGKALAEMAKSLPNEGGWMGEIFGDNDMAEFGEKLVGFGSSLMAYGEAVSGIDSYTDAIESSVSAAEALVEVAAAVPNTGGLWSMFTGDNDIDAFGTDLVSFGTSLKAYGAAVTELDVDAIEDSIDAAEALVEIADVVPNTGGLWTVFTGDNDFATFGTHLVSFGSALKDYSDSVEDLEIESIEGSIEAAKALSEIEGALSNSGGMVSWFTGDNDIGTFGDNILQFGTAMKDYSDEVSGISTSKLSATTAQFTKIANMASDMASIDFDGLGSFGESLGNVGKVGVDAFIEAFAGANDKVNRAGQMMITNLVNGVKSKVTFMTSAFRSAVSNGVSVIRDKYDSFYKAGSHLVTGFVNGISANSYKVEAKAAAMALAAKRAAEEALDINSPSKVFYDIGAFTGQGFVRALTDYNSNVYDASTDMATMARTGFGDAISRINDALDGNMDVQPTISPVLDLSNVRAGAGTISNLLSNRASLGVLANVGSINASMNRRGQNGANGDIVDAIGKLGKEMREYDRNSYTINGITYDDGSNIAEAVGSIVRLAKVERRR